MLVDGSGTGSGCVEFSGAALVLLWGRLDWWVRVRSFAGCRQSCGHFIGSGLAALIHSRWFWFWFWWWLVDATICATDMHCRYALPICIADMVRRYAGPET